MAGVAITFNPVLPLHMHKPDWRVFNLIAVGIFVVWISVLARTLPDHNVTDQRDVH